MSSSSCTGSGSGSPCGACKFLRRKCAPDCVFAPYFSNENGPARFAAIHKVFGASNTSKLLLHVPQQDRCEAVVTITYEAQARICDPVYGCVAHIFALQQQVASLQAQLMQAKAQLAHGIAAGSRSSSSSSSSSIMENQCDAHLLHSYMNLNMNMNTNMNTNGESMSPQSSLDCAEEDDHPQVWSKRRHAPPHSTNEQGELHALASRMMRNY